MTKKRVWGAKHEAYKLQSPIKTYFLTDEELAYYRSLPPPVRENDIRTTANKSVKKRRGY